MNGVVIGTAGSGKDPAMKKIIETVTKQEHHGIIVSAYTGMGQEIYMSIHDDYKILYLDEYDTTLPDFADIYAKDALKAVTTDGFKVCFVSSRADIIKAISSLQESFVIFYPSTKIPKDKYLLRMFEMFGQPRSTHKVRFDKMIADVIKNYDRDIRELAHYANSISASMGIINEEVLNTFIDMDIKKRKDVLNAIGTMKDMKASAYSKSSKKKKKKNKRH